MVCENLFICIAGASLIGFIYLFFLPFTIYQLSIFWNHRHFAGIQARYPILIMILVIFAVIQNTICEPFYYLHDMIEVKYFNIYLAHYISSIILTPIMLAFVIGLVFRIYLITYDINLAVQQTKRNWQSLLAPAAVQDDWYSRNIASWGNWKCVYKLFLLYFIVTSIIGITFSIFEHPSIFGLQHSIPQTIYGVLILAAAVPVEILFSRTPYFEDAYFIRQEVQWQIRVTLVVFPVFIACTVLSKHDGDVFALIERYSMVFFTSSTSAISVWWSLRKLRNGDHLRLMHRGSIHRSSVIRNTAQANRQPEEKPKDEIPISNLFSFVLNNEIGIHAFMTHLLSEFSAENLLAFIEIVQWIQDTTGNNLHEFEIEPFTEFDFQLDDSIPLSSINQDNKLDWYQKIVEIHAKYIHSSAQHQINLPYHLQMTFLGLLNIWKVKKELQSGKRKAPKKRLHFRAPKIILFKKNSLTASHHSSLNVGIYTPTVRLSQKLNLTQLFTGLTLTRTNSNIRTPTTGTPTTTPIQKKPRKQYQFTSVFPDATPVSPIIENLKEEKSMYDPDEELPKDKPAAPNFAITVSMHTSEKDDLKDLKKRSTKPEEKEEPELKFSPEDLYLDDDDDEIQLKKERSAELAQLSQDLENEIAGLVIPKDADLEPRVTTVINTCPTFGDDISEEPYPTPEEELEPVPLMDQETIESGLLECNYGGISDIREVGDSSSSTAATATADNKIVVRKITITEPANQQPHTELSFSGSDGMVMVGEEYENDTLMLNDTESQQEQDAKNKPRVEHIALPDAGHNKQMSASVSVFQSVFNSTMELAPTQSNIMRSDTDYDAEVKLQQQAKDVNLHDFVALLCQVLSVILQLNFQSLGRWKRTESYKKFENSVKLSAPMLNKQQKK